MPAEALAAGVERATAEPVREPAQEPGPGLVPEPLGLVPEPLGPGLVPEPLGPGLNSTST